ncbi:MAG: hypothetical protein DHS20C12_23040 [Pseudohongiella sp.]|nr:MAG: hypothetical protein DHS20C12_23040 [Pseudohongiella sp.]
MRANLTDSISPTRTSLLASVVFCSTLFSALPPLSNAQEIDFQQSIDSTSEALIALDVMASDCLAELDSATQPGALCDGFLAGIDGELMADYLEQCRVLKEWRDEYVDSTVASNLDADSESNEEMLRRLISIEFSCGENTLRSRTQFVFTAFNRLRGDAGASTVDRQLSESRFEALDDRERQRLQDTLRDQRSRSLRESDRQFNDLENELLRQQIRNSNLPD